MLEELSKLLDFPIRGRHLGSINGYEVKFILIEQDAENSDYYNLYFETNKDTYNKIGRLVNKQEETSGSKAIPLKISIKDKDFSCSVNIIKRNFSNRIDIEADVYSEKLTVEEFKES